MEDTGIKSEWKAIFFVQFGWNDKERQYYILLNALHGPWNDCGVLSHSSFKIGIFYQSQGRERIAIHAFKNVIPGEEIEENANRRPRDSFFSRSERSITLTFVACLRIFWQGIYIMIILLILKEQRIAFNEHLWRLTQWLSLSPKAAYCSTNSLQIKPSSKFKKIIWNLFWVVVDGNWVVANVWFESKAQVSSNKTDLKNLVVTSVQSTMK